MRLNAEQIEAIRQESEQCFRSQAEMRLVGKRVDEKQRGFTLVELVTVILILGIISVVALPRFFERVTFDSRAFSDQVKATLRLAQKLAIAQHRNVCVNIATAAPASLTIKVSSTTPGTCDMALPSLSGGGNYQITAPGNAALTVSASAITFDALGSPGAADITLQVDTEPAITVEKETGYVF